MSKQEDSVLLPFLRFRKGDLVMMKKVPETKGFELLFGVVLKVLAMDDFYYTCAYLDTPETSCSFPVSFERWLVRVEQ